VRSYVVEQPFEELVRLRDETVRVERRPASGMAPVGEDAFKERSFEVRERDEEAVVEKTARVKEEVVVSKDVGERTEKVRDKTRRTQVDVEKEPETVGSGPGNTARPRR
jgi:stress response protein YsnF